MYYWEKLKGSYNCKQERAHISLHVLSLLLCVSPGECHSAVIQAVEDLDLSKVLPLGRQHGILNSLEIVLKNISHLISAYLPKILQLLLCMTATVSHILDQREKVSKIHFKLWLSSWAHRTSLVAQLVKNLSAIQEILV